MQNTRQSKARVSAAAAVVLAGACASASALPLSDDPLAAERWKTRPLVIVAPTPEDLLLKSVEAQLRSPPTKRGFDEREMVLFTVVAGRGQRNGRPMTQPQTHAMLVSLGASPSGPAEALLIGKDGGIKLRQGGAAVPLAEVFALIDGMPMRQREKASATGERGIAHGSR